MSSFTCSPLHPLFAAEAEGIDLRTAADDSLATEVEAAMDEFAVLVFRDQNDGVNK